METKQSYEIDRRVNSEENKSEDRKTLQEGVTYEFDGRTHTVQVSGTKSGKCFVSVVPSPVKC